MKCADCVLDYKRDDIELIEKHFNDMELKRMVDFRVALKKEKEEKEKEEKEEKEKEKKEKEEKK